MQPSTPNIIEIHLFISNIGTNSFKTGHMWHSKSA